MSVRMAWAGLLPTRLRQHVGCAIGVGNDAGKQGCKDSLDSADTKMCDPD